MTDLPGVAPQPSDSRPKPASQPAPVAPNPPAGTGVGGKEFEGGIAISAEFPLSAVSQEVELPKEVASAGVKVQPTTVPIPPKVAKMGVQPAGVNVPPPQPASVTLPLTDDQIVVGLNQGVASSWRWLAEWCIRRLKQVHLGIQKVHGAFIRVRT